MTVMLVVMVTVSPAEEVFARNGSKTRDLTAARESKNSFELQNNDHQGEDLGGGKKPGL